MEEEENSRPRLHVFLSYSLVATHFNRGAGGLIYSTAEAQRRTKRCEIYLIPCIPSFRTNPDNPFPERAAAAASKYNIFWSRYLTISRHNMGVGA